MNNLPTPPDTYEWFLYSTQGRNYLALRKIGWFRRILRMPIVHPEVVNYRLIDVQANHVLNTFNNARDLYRTVYGREFK